MSFFDLPLLRGYTVIGCVRNTCDIVRSARVARYSNGNIEFSVYFFSFAIDADVRLNEPSNPYGIVVLYYHLVHPVFYFGGKRVIIVHLTAHNACTNHGLRYGALQQVQRTLSVDKYNMFIICTIVRARSACQSEWCLLVINNYSNIIRVELIVCTTLTISRV